MKKMKITQMDYIKANRKASRDEEIAEHGWPSRQHAIHKSKKVYDRKRMKRLTKKSITAIGQPPKFLTAPDNQQTKERKSRNSFSLLFVGDIVEGCKITTYQVLIA